MSIQLPFEVKAGSKVHILVDECKLHSGGASYITVTNASNVSMPGSSNDNVVFKNKEYVATINSDIASGSYMEIGVYYFYTYGNISKIWITEN